MSLRNLWALVTALTIGATSATLVQAQESFYKGKQLQMFVGFAAGGPNDIWTRIVGRGMVRHLAGNPTLVVQQMPGAGSLRLTNYLANVAPRDGTQIGLIARGIPFEPLFGGQGVQFDPRTLAYIGSPATETTVCAVRSDLNYVSIDDFYQRETIVGTGGGGSETNLAPLMLKNVFGMKFKIIAGFGSGGTDVALAIERKELDGICISYTTLSNLSLYKNGGIREQLVLSEGPLGPLKTVPNIYDREISDRQRKILRVTFAREVLGRPIIGPPGLPTERLEALRTAFDAAMKDDGVIAEARQANFDMTPTAGSNLQKHVEEIYATTPPDVAAEVAKAVGN